MSKPYRLVGLATCFPLAGTLAVNTPDASPDVRDVVHAELARMITGTFGSDDQSAFIATNATQSIAPVGACRSASPDGRTRLTPTHDFVLPSPPSRANLMKSPAFRFAQCCMADSTPLIDLEAEAQQVAVQAVPGAVFLRLRRENADGSIRRMFVELTIDEATFLRRELDASIRTATKTGRH